MFILAPLCDKGDSEGSVEAEPGRLRGRKGPRKGLGTDGVLSALSNTLGGHMGLQRECTRILGVEGFR